MSLRKAIDCVWIFLVIIQCHTYFVHIAFFTNVSAYLKVIIFMLLMMRIIVGEKYKIKGKEFFFLCIYNLAMLLLCLSSYYFWDLGFISTDIIIFSLIFISISGTDYMEILEIYSTIIYVICCISLVFFALSTCLHIIKPTSHVLLYWGTTEYHNIYFGIYSEIQHVTSFFYSGFRNTAIWVEGPMIAFNVVCTSQQKSYTNFKKSE